MTRAERAPGPRGLSLASAAVLLLRDPSLAQRLVREYGDLVTLRAGPMEVFLVGHPDLAREVLEADGDRFDRGAGTEPVKRLLGEGLLVSTGHLHRRQRGRVEPLLSREAVNAHADVVVDEAGRVREAWRAGVAVDVFDEMRDAAARVMIRALGPDVDALETERVVRALATSVVLAGAPAFPEGEGPARAPRPPVPRGSGDARPLCRGGGRARPRGRGAARRGAASHAARFRPGARRIHARRPGGL